MTTLARRMHGAVEPLHTVVYFSRFRKPTYTAAGLESRHGYFASRAAPMGAVPLEVVVATFYNFSPAIVGTVIPEAWSLASPERILEARLEVADLSLRDALGDDVVEGRAMAEAAELARAATAACRPEGRPLYAGHASLPWPEAPHLQLWHAAALLREHRGDGHVAVLVGAGLSGPEALAKHRAAGGIDDGVVSTRSWPEHEWQAALTALRARGILDDQGGLTAAGRALRDEVEAHTDELAAPPWASLGSEGCDRLEALVAPWAAAVAGDAGAYYRRPR